MSSPSVGEVIAALAARKNVLLEGPPGTGKTRLVSDLVATLRSTAQGGGRPTINPTSAAQPFASASGSGSQTALPTTLSVDWVTFHQSYSYEEFILGKRPVSSPRGLEIEPHLGLLMTLAVELDMPAAPDGCVLIIDEINRANASQVFGEFITLLDPDYRRSVNGTANPSAVSPRLPGLRYSGGVSEPVAMLRGVGYVALREDWTFPEHVYVVATMNSVDKAALPLDSALSRRFFRMSMPPDLLVLASSLGLTWPAVEAAGKAARVPGGNVGGLSAEITTVLLLERLNYVIATDLGEDFELGHGLLWEVVRAGSSARWQALAAAWDTVLLPQLIERFAGRADALRRVLKVGEATGSGSVIVDRHLIGAAAEPDSPLFMPALVGASVNDVQATLRFLAI